MAKGIKIRKLDESIGICSPELVSEIYRIAKKLEADFVQVEYADWNYAEVTLFEGNDCIDWGMPVRV